MKLMMLMMMVSQQAYAYCRTETIFIGGRSHMVTRCDQPDYQRQNEMYRQNLMNMPAPQHMRPSPVQEFNQGVQQFNRGLQQYNGY